MIEVYVPATSANCCVGFDCLGMAVDWWAHFTFEESDTLEVDGCPDEFKGKDNLVVQALYTACDYLKVEYPTFKLTIDTDIPFARGLGSSSTCVVAGIMACDAWFKKGLSKSELLKIATSMEGHPDNVAPAIFGQATACFMEAEDVRMSHVPCADYHCLVMVPHYEVKTQQARKVLPKTMDFKDCVSQVSHALVFLQALQQGDEALLAQSCKDLLHEPYRKQFIKEYDTIKKYCKNEKIPMWISGSGSTMMVVSLEQSRLITLSKYVEENFKELDFRFLTIAKKGAFIKYE